MDEEKNHQTDGEDTKECPYCAETIKAKAKACRFCGKELYPVDTAATPSPPPSKKSTVKAESGVADGVKLGCGMFIILPLLILAVGAIIFFFIVVAAN